MKTVIVCLTSCLLLGGFESNGAQLLTGPVTNPSNGHQYYLTTANTWTAAEGIAVSLGGHLATVRNTAENSWIYNTFSSFGGVERYLWIGLNDVVQEGAYAWTSGESNSYLNWANGEPNNGGGFYPNEDWVHMWNPSSGYPAGTWVDAQDISTDGTYTYHGVVEVVSVPEPSVAALVVGLALAGRALRPRR